MYKLKSFLVIAALMAATVAQAQVKKPAETEVKQMSHTQVLFENMLQATQKLLIIDSIVVAKDSFIDYIPLPPECGSIKRTKYGYQFVNEIGDKMFYSICDTMGSARIYSKPPFRGSPRRPFQLSFPHGRRGDALFLAQGFGKHRRI